MRTVVSFILFIGLVIGLNYCSAPRPKGPDIFRGLDK